MKKILLVISIGFATMLAAVALLSSSEPVEDPYAATQDSLFEEAVKIIKKYETLHQPRHWPYVGYGHRILPGEHFSRSKAVPEKQAEAILRKDLLKNCAVFRDWGRDSLLLGVLAYNIGSGTVKGSTLAKMLKNGDRDIENVYYSYSKYRGKTHQGIRKRRIEEFNTLFINDTTTTITSPSNVG